jgi:single-strand DNA-binding protein
MQGVLIMSDYKMPDINNVLIAGNLTNDPIFRKTSNGTPVVNFYIASNRKYRDNSGIWRENMCYVGIVAWNKLAESCNKFLKKTSSVLVDGELQSRNWRNEDGTTRNVVEIRARRIQFLDQGIAADVEEVITPYAENKMIELPEAAASVEAAQTAETMEDIKVEPTDFDFGYQDLKF